MDSYDADYTNSVAMVKLCRKDVENCTYEKRYDFLQRKFQATIVHEELSEPEPYCLPCLPASPRVQCDSSYSSLSSSSTQQRRLRHSFTLLTPDRKKIDVCCLAWCHVTVYLTTYLTRCRKIIEWESRKRMETFSTTVRDQSMQRKSGIKFVWNMESEWIERQFRLQSCRTP